MDTHAIVDQIVLTAQRMVALNLALGTAGNVSARIDTNTFAITPTGIAYDQLRPDDVVVVNPVTLEVVAGKRKPSSETPMHAAVYRVRPDIGGIVHTHSLYATAFAARGEPIEAIHYAIATIGDVIPVVPYYTYGSPELAAAAATVLATGKGALLANHGVLALGDDLREAMYHAETIEYLAQLGFVASGLGGGKVLTPSELATVREGFRGYGQ